MRGGGHTSKLENNVLNNPHSPLFAPIDTLHSLIYKTNSCPYLPQLYGIYKSFDEINFASLPHSFVIKTNHDCGGVILVKDKETFLKDEKVKQAREKIQKHLSINYYDMYREWHYKDIEPRVLVEELLSQIPLCDYRFHCFGINIGFIQVANATHTANSLFDAHWNLLPITYLNEIHKEPIPSPPLLSLMIEVARILSKPLGYVRVDLFSIGQKVVVGELTFTPNGGCGKFNPENWDKHFGLMWEIVQ